MSHAVSRRGVVHDDIRNVGCVHETPARVEKHDGSRHHGVGIQPTIAASRTIAGIRAGRDEVLERGIEAVR